MAIFSEKKLSVHKFPRKKTFLWPVGLELIEVLYSRSIIIDFVTLKELVYWLTYTKVI